MSSRWTKGTQTTKSGRQVPSWATTRVEKTTPEKVEEAKITVSPIAAPPMPKSAAKTTPSAKRGPYASEEGAIRYGRVAGTASGRRASARKIADVTLAIAGAKGETVHLKRATACKNRTNRFSCDVDPTCRWKNEQCMTQSQAEPKRKRSASRERAAPAAKKARTTPAKRKTTTTTTTTAAAKKRRSASVGKKTVAGRKAPKAKAGDYKVGSVMKGLDGNDWKVVKTAKTTRWQRV